MSSTQDVRFHNVKIYIFFIFNLHWCFFFEKNKFRNFIIKNDTANYCFVIHSVRISVIEYLIVLNWTLIKAIFCYIFFISFEKKIFLIIMLHMLESDKMWYIFFAFMTTTLILKSLPYKIYFRQFFNSFYHFWYKTTCKYSRCIVQRQQLYNIWVYLYIDMPLYILSLLVVIVN